MRETAGLVLQTTCRKCRRAVGPNSMQLVETEPGRPEVWCAACLLDEGGSLSVWQAATSLYLDLAIERIGKGDLGGARYLSKKTAELLELVEKRWGSNDEDSVS